MRDDKERDDSDEHPCSYLMASYVFALCSLIEESIFIKFAVMKILMLCGHKKFLTRITMAYLT